MARVVEMSDAAPSIAPPTPTRNSTHSMAGGGLSPQSRSQVARKACSRDDSALSRWAHDKLSLEVAKESHSKVGEHVKSIVFGGLDGIITTFAVISGAVGGGLSVDVILILGFSNLIADGFSMGFGDALSSKAENEYILSEKKREEWEFDNYKEGEIKEMVKLYQERGMNAEDAECVILKMAKYRDFFVDVMMKEELELQVPGEDDNPWKSGAVTFLAFLAFGMVPLLVYAAAGTSSGVADSTLFAISCGLTMCTFVVLGVVKAYIAGQNLIRGGAEILAMGTFTAGIAYSLGLFVHDALGVDVSDK